MLKIGKAATVLLIFVLLISSVVTTAFYYNSLLSDRNSQLSNRDSKISALQSQIAVLKTANLETALGVVEVPADRTTQLYWANNNSHVWITGYVFNSGGSMAINAGVQVPAFDKNNSTLMNVTVPISFGVFDTSEKKNLIPGYYQASSMTFGNIFSQQNVTVRVGIYHEGFFSNSTTYKIIPVWTNPP
jgi:hypothetical protein